MTTAAVRSATDPRPRRGPVGRRALQVVLFVRAGPVTVVRHAPLAAKGATAAEPARRAVAVQDQVAGAADKVTGTLHDAISRSDVLAPQGILDEQVLQGVHGDAVAPFAQGVTGRVMPLAHGVGAQAQPFAGGLVGTVGDDVRPAVGNAAHGAEGLTSITPTYVTDATGSVPSFGAPEYPARSI
ncbi:hypothetical protein [Streptomyces sp. NPDC057557]|uniref:hypothetical protein n=1 Tax=Streptomyces sp. NPDC057557 TaxID=3346167 RepID=UPI00369023B7